MPIGTGIIYNVGDLILSQVSGSSTSFLETKIAAATSSIVYFDSTARINSASLNSITVGTASYVSGSTSIITNLTASNISASGTSSFGYVGIGTSSPSTKLHVRLDNAGETTLALFENRLTDFASAAAGQIVVGARGYNHTVLRQNPDLGTTPSIGSSLDTVLANTCALGSGFGKLILATQSTASLIIDYSGNVGIGTSSPAYKLDVNGQGLFRDTLNFGPSVGTISWGTMGGGTGFGIRGESGRGFSLGANGSWDYLVINTSGNVGIGTTSPTAKLHIYNGSSHFEATSNGNAAIVAGLYALQIAPLSNRDSTAGSYYGGIAFNHLLNHNGVSTYNGAPQAWIGTRLQDTAGSERDYLVFATKPGTGTSGTGNDIPIERVCIDRDGNVGIGTTNPTINGGGLHVYGSGQKGIRISGNSSNSYSVEIGCDATKMSFIQTVGTADRGLQFYTGNASTVVMTLTGSNVGIGTTSPSSKFEVLTSAVALANQPNIIGNFRGDTDGRSLIRVDNTSTSAGAAALQSGISFVAYSNVSSQPSANKHEAQIILGSTGANSVTGGQTGTLQIVAPQDIAFNVSASNTIMTGSNYTAFGYNAMYIARSGNIGIGTTVPGALLEVSSSTAASLLNVKGAGGNGILYVSGSGAVGIGTTSISDGARLTIAGETRIASSAAYFTHLNYLDGGNNIISSANGGSTIFRGSSNNITAMTILGSGNVGIGTSSPGGKFEIRTDAASNYIFSGSSTSGYTTTFTMDDTASYFGHDSSVRSLILRTNSTSRLTVKGDGNVGIGTTSPIAKLEAYGGSMDPTLTPGDPSIFSVNSLGVQLAVGRMVSSPFSVWLQGKHATVGGGLTYPIVLNPLGGFVGIGTTSPAAKLHVVGDEYVTGNVTIGLTSNYSNLNFIRNGGSAVGGVGWRSDGYFYVGGHPDYGPGAGNDVRVRGFGGSLILGTNSTDYVYLNTSGNVGIGTTSPATLLHVDTAGADARIRVSAGSNTVQGGMIANTNGLVYAGSVTNHGFSLRTNDTDRVRIQTDGNVGIGITSPTVKLTVSADVTDADVGQLRLVGSTSSAKMLSLGYQTTSNYGFISALIAGTGYSNLALQPNGGNVGIGTTSPDKKLQVIGSLGKGYNLYEVSINLLQAIGTQAKRFEIARVFIDYNDWNSTGPVEIEVRENYYSDGRYKKYIFSYGYSSSNVGSLWLIEDAGRGANDFKAEVGAAVLISGDIYYVPIYIDVDYYQYVDVLVRTNRTRTTNASSAAGGVIYINESPTGSNISSFSPDEVTYLSLASSKTYLGYSGNVGIGTTSPAYKLDVSGDLRISGSGSTVGTFKSSASSCFISLIDSSNDNVFLGNDDGDFLIQTPTSAYSTKLIVKDDGNVGIGTTTPANKLEVVSDTANNGSPFAGCFFSGDDSSAMWRCAINLQHNANTTIAIGSSVGLSFAPLSSTNSNFYGSAAIKAVRPNTTANNQDTDLAFWTRTGASNNTVDTEKLRITGTGNVGIGTTSPTAPLHVVGVISGSSFTGAGTGLTGTAASLTAGAVTNGVYTTGAQSVGGVKSFTSTMNVTGVRETMTTVAAATNVAINLNLGTIFKLTFSSTVSTFTITNTDNTNVAAGNSFTLISAPDNSNAKTIAFSFITNGAAATAVKWATFAGGTTPTATITSGKFDVFSFVYDGVNWYGFTGGLTY